MASSGRRAAALLTAVLLAASGAAAVAPIPSTGAASPGDCAGAAAPSFCVRLPPPDPGAAPASDGPREAAEPCAAAAGIPAFCVRAPVAGPRPAEDAPAHRDAACARLVASEAPTFCVAAPSGPTGARRATRELGVALLRQRLGTSVRRVGSAAPDLWVEAGVTTAAAARVRAAVVAELEAVERFFARSLEEAPAVFYFATRPMFAAALTSALGVAADEAARLAETSGGLDATGLDAILVNGAALPPDGSLDIVRHELVHVFVHDLAGDGTVPAWLDEGLATAVPGPRGAAPRDLAALSLLAVGLVSLEGVDDAAAWSRRNRALDGHLYGVAAEAARLVIAARGGPAIAALLERVGGGVPFAAAYAAAMGEPAAELVRTLADRVFADACRLGFVVDEPDGAGLVTWHLYGFPARSEVTLTVAGSAYALTYPLRADDRGLASGTVGGPMPAGLYRLTASGATGVAVADVPVGRPGAAAPRGAACTPLDRAALGAPAGGAMD